ncbi:DUF4232 domain-containing protein [Nocardioides mangrovi]|uniref:DUF4232 domain-containing protein n=1 Tax=Nocardioides mangrovi TaxID=2874580 RepID=A0ABS7U7Y7_9ACTN|nr:DUF4232 domain-containing protein [Nocardioides mangrovi]MBZ5736782.1 DUF4232 domain-containing protein [Nocardioides mangrovi]
MGRREGAVALLLAVLMTFCAAAPRTGGAQATRTRTCAAGQVRLEVTAADSVMSQPFVDIAVIDTGPASCTLRGYPRLRAPGHRLRVRHGVYERGDPRPTSVAVRPGRGAVFSVGTATAYQGGRRLTTLSRLAVVLPGSDTALPVRVDLPATRPAGRAFPVGVTAITPARRTGTPRR